MIEEEHFRKLERMYATAPINAFFEPVLRISEGKAVIEIPVKEGLFHAAGAVHGSAYFKAMDDAAYFAANSLVEDVFVLTIQYNLYLTRPISKGVLRARGKVVSATKNLIIAEAELLDGEGRQLARGSGSFVRSRIPLTPEIGYQ